MLGAVADGPAHAAVNRLETRINKSGRTEASQCRVRYTGALSAIKLDCLLFDRRLTVSELADRIGITIANSSVLKTNKARYHGLLRLRQSP